MEERKFCQSCSMPLDDGELFGTEKDGSKNGDYCKYCYHHGSFTKPDMTLNEMRSSIIHRMEKEEIPEDIIETAVSRIKNLKRWRKEGVHA